MSFTNKGFTLMELLVTLTVVSILTSFAMPKFKEYQAKSRETEGFIISSQVFIAEMAFYSQAGGFTQCIKEIGVGSNTAGYYSYGFLGDTGNSEQVYVDDGILTSLCPGESGKFFQGEKGIERNAPTYAELIGTPTLSDRFTVTTPDLQYFRFALVGYVGYSLAQSTDLIFPAAYAQAEEERLSWLVLTEKQNIYRLSSSYSQIGDALDKLNIFEGQVDGIQGSEQ